MGLKNSAVTSETKDLLEYFRKLEADVAVLKNVNKNVLQQITDNERQCWENAWHSQRECLKVVHIPSSVGNTALEGKVMSSIP